MKRRRQTRQWSSRKANWLAKIKGGPDLWCLYLSHGGDAGVKFPNMTTVHLDAMLDCLQMLIDSREVDLARAKDRFPGGEP